MAKVDLSKDNYVHPNHPDKRVKIDLEIDEDKLGELIEKLRPHKDKDPKGHTANIPSTYLRGLVTLK